MSICPKREFHQNRCIVISIRTDQKAIRALNSSRARRAVNSRTTSPERTEGMRADTGVTSPVREEHAAIHQNRSGGFSV